MLQVPRSLGIWLSVEVKLREHAVNFFNTIGTFGYGGKHKVIALSKLYARHGLNAVLLAAFHKLKNTSRAIDIG
jgi:tRNA1(Val) A37 N6-methylase TrmN6